MLLPLIEQLDQLIEQKHMLRSPFYQAWSCGHLTKEQLQTYAKEYYHHVKAFPTYLSALHSRCEEPHLRKPILNNLIDEEAGEPNHPDLWRSFILALGVREDELESHRPGEQTSSLVAAFKECCTSLPLAAGAAALYCYESQIPAICQSKIEGLKKWYGVNQPEQYRYFSVHETADVAHAEEEKKLIAALAAPGEEPIIIKAANKILDELNEFLSSFLFIKKGIFC
jgi:pyrroloquinoline-quinone synthase